MLAIIIILITGIALGCLAVRVLRAADLINQDGSIRKQSKVKQESVFFNGIEYKLN